MDSLTIYSSAAEPPLHYSTRPLRRSLPGAISTIVPFSSSKSATLCSLKQVCTHQRRKLQLSRILFCARLFSVLYIGEPLPHFTFLLPIQNSGHIV